MWISLRSMIVIFAPSSSRDRRLAMARPPRPLPAMTMRAEVFSEACADWGPIDRPAPATTGRADAPNSRRRRVLSTSGATQGGAGVWDICLSFPGRGLCGAHGAGFIVAAFSII
ncbi:protein of unknown function [Thauera humireducens]|nr:protein of unknown function [Thauera humireducens]